MTQSESINKLIEALCGFQGELVAMPKSCEGYGYKYTDLDTIATTIRPILAKYGLGYMQPIETVDGRTVMKTRVFHKTGEFIETDLVLAAVAVSGTNAVQQLGAGITYMRRYSLCSLLGITSEEDTDGVEKTQERPQYQKKAPQYPKKEPATKQPAPKKQDQSLAGGESTSEQKEAMRTYMYAKYDNGQPVFSKDEIMAYSNLRKTTTADDVIKLIVAESTKRFSAYVNAKVDAEAAKLGE